MEKRGNNFLEKSQKRVASLSKALVDGAWVLALFRSFLPASQFSYVREFWSQNKEFLDLKTSQKLANSFLVKVQSSSNKMA